MSVYNDRLILWNPGKLPEDITIEILKQKHPSRPANRNIAELFFKAGYIEIWGRGIAKILNACMVAGLPEPDMKEFAGGIQVTFFKRNKVVDRVVEKVVDRVVENLTDHQKQVIKSIIENPKISALEISTIIGLSHRKTQDNIKKLKDKGILKRVGSDKGGFWEVVNNNG
jgi:ATP-dependent DNA helicase RecG